MTTVTLSRLSHVYGKRSQRVFALQDVSLTVGSGELLAVLGPSGCGKTTLLRIIAGLQQPTSGDIQFDGVSVTGLAPKKRGVMMVFQDDQLFPYMTVQQNVAFGLKSQGMFGKKLRQHITETLALVQMRGYEKRFPHELSGGEQQRIALARAIAIQPRVLLLDEPLSHLDATLRDQLRDTIRDIQRQLNITMLLVTHDQAEAMSVADRIAVLFQGQLQQITTPDALYRAPANERIARFLGMPNILEGQLMGQCIHTDFGELSIGQSAAVDDRTVTFIIPTTAFELCDNSFEPTTNRFRATVLEQKRYGQLIRYSLQVGANVLYMDRLQPIALDTTNTLNIYIDPQNIQVLP